MSSNAMSRKAVVVDSRLVISSLEVDQSDVVRGAVHHSEATGDEDVSDYVTSALEVGAKAMALAGSTVDVEEIRRAMKGFADDVAGTAKVSVQQIKDVVQTAAGAEDGTIARAVSTAVNNLQTSLTTLVAGEDAPVRAAIAKTVTDVSNGFLEEIQRALSVQNEAVRQALSSENPASPLNLMRLEILRHQSQTAAEIQVQLTEVKTLIDVAAAVKATMQRTAIKGIGYEAQIVAVLDRIANGCGDVLEPTANITGILGGSKKGDAVITLGKAVSRNRMIHLVIEAKDKTMSPEAWRMELDQARKNRGAVAALGVVKGVEHMPGHDRLRVIDPLTFVVAFDPENDDEDLLIAAVQLLRTQAVCVELESDADVDIVGIRTHLGAAVDLLAQFDKVTKALTQAGANLDTVRSTAAKLRNDLMDRLQRGLRLVDSSAEQPAAA